jgi:error-prone DNA polymerase
VLTGSRQGPVRLALEQDGPDAAAAEWGWLVDRLGAAHVAVELTDHGYPEDSQRNDLLAQLAIEYRQCPRTGVNRSSPSGLGPCRWGRVSG